MIPNAQCTPQSDPQDTMVIPSYGFALWANIKSPLDQHINATGHQNVYIYSSPNLSKDEVLFPLFQKKF